MIRVRTRTYRGARRINQSLHNLRAEQANRGLQIEGLVAGLVEQAVSLPLDGLRRTA